MEQVEQPVGVPARGIPLCLQLGTAVLACCALGCQGAPRNTPGQEGDDAAHTAHWGYGEDDGPAVWASMSPEFALCGSGKEQSPVDLSEAVSADDPELETDYQPVTLKIAHHEHVAEVLNNGHTIQVNYDEGSTLRIGDLEYELKQFHFHAPSEHTIDGRHSPMEMHLVHQGAAGLGVLGVLVEEGAFNPAFDPIWTHLPREPGAAEHVEHVTVDIDDLLPSSRRAYRYRGSLTTPPCSEGVSWLVAVEPIELSSDQISAFTSIVNPNNRPVQPLHERSLMVDRVH